MYLNCQNTQDKENNPTWEKNSVTYENFDTDAK